MTALPQTTPADGLVLDHVELGLDPTDLGYTVDEEYAEVYFHDGPVFTLTGWDRTDADTMRAAAEWLDGLADQTRLAADELRRQANSLCDDCSGAGTVEIWNGEQDCRRCQGSGVLQ